MQAGKNKYQFNKEEACRLSTFSGAQITNPPPSDESSPAKRKSTGRLLIIPTDERLPSIEALIIAERKAGIAEFRVPLRG